MTLLLNRNLHLTSDPGEGTLSGKGTHTATERKAPRPHQKEAVADIVPALRQSGDDIRTQCVMACGTGKTLVGLWASEKLGNRTLLCEPTLNLIAQNIREWKASFTGPKPEILVVCSDDTTVQINRDEAFISKEEVGARVTNDPHEIRAFLGDKSSRKILVSTYNSLPLVEEAMKDKRISGFDCTVVDEAHRTASHAESFYSLVHNGDAIRSRTRLYLTATPRVFINGGDSVLSMDDAKTFGEVSHRLTFSKAIERKLLTDYQLVVAAIPERDAKLLQERNLSSTDIRGALAELAFLRAVKNHHLTKAVTFHSTVERARGLADRLEYSAQTHLPGQKVWVHAIHGKMPTSTRTHLLNIFKEQSPKTLSVVSNCRCLSEGVDVPALDAAVFFDPRESEIDIVQAVGRVMRLSETKTVGTVLVPVVVPEGVDADAFLGSSEFKKVAQVLRALRAHDDSFGSKVLKLTGKVRNEEEQSTRTPRHEGLTLDINDLPVNLRESLTTRVVRVGMGLRAELLTEDGIREAARGFHKLHGKLPSSDSKKAVPGMPGETWGAINNAGQLGLRGMTKGRTLSIILEPLRKELGPTNALFEDKILAAAREFHKIHGRLPSCHSKETVPGLPAENWGAIDSAGQNGNRGLNKGRTLSKILKPLREELGLDNTLIEDEILDSAREFYELYRSLPTRESKEPVPGMDGENWGAIDSALKGGCRGLREGQSLYKILEPLRLELGLNRELSENKIIQAARDFFSIYGRLPSGRSKEAVPGMDGETWRGFDLAGHEGYRGLAKGQTLSKILTNLRHELCNTLNEDKIIKAARKFHAIHGSLPTRDSEPAVPGIEIETWRSLDRSLKRGSRGLQKGKTLSRVLDPLRKELGVDGFLTENKIIEAAQKFYEAKRKLPTTECQEAVPSMPGETWAALNAAGYQGCRGLTKGRTLSKILAPLRAELGL